jgi:predicted nucleic acid-binding protein
MGLLRDRVLPFAIEAIRRHADSAVKAKTGGRGVPTPDGYCAAIATARGFIVASHDIATYEAAGVPVLASSTL